MMSLEVKKEIRSRIFSIINTSLFLILATWFWFGPRAELTEAKTTMNQNVKGDSISLQELSEGIHLDNAYPVSDEEGMQVEPYRFEITNQGQTSSKYAISFINDEIAITNDGCQVLSNNYIRYTIKKDDGTYTTPRNLPLDGVMYEDELETGKTAVYEVKFWIDQNAGNEIMNKHFHTKLFITEK